MAIHKEWLSRSWYPLCDCVIRAELKGTANQHFGPSLGNLNQFDNYQIKISSFDLIQEL